MADLRLLLLGPPRVELDGKPVEIERRKALALLVYLATSNQPRSRDTLATLFWPDHTQSRARAYLRRDLAVLNTSLGGDWLISDRDTVELKRTAGLWVDIDHFRHLWSLYQNHDHPPGSACAPCLARLKEAADLYSDDFLAGFTLRDSPEFDDWQFFQAESLRQDLALILEALVQAYIAHKEYEPAIPYARRWVALDNLHEPAQRLLIRLYDQAGQQAAALRQYQEYADFLEEELGIPPEEETTTLYEAIKAKRILGPFIKAEERAGRLSSDEARPPASNKTTAVNGTLQPPQIPVRINLLGRFEVIREGRVLRAGDWPHSEASQLLQLLAVEQGLHRDQAAGLLWPDIEPGDAAGRWDAAVGALRQILDDGLGAGTAEAIFTDNAGGLSLNQGVEIDVQQFKELAHNLPAAAPEQISAPGLQQALVLYQGDLLPGASTAAWAETARGSLRRLHREVLRALVAHHRTTQNYTAAIPLLASHLAKDPEDETLHRELMELYVLAGRRHEALRHYRLCCEALAAEQRSPAPETEALYQQIVSGEIIPPAAPVPKPAWLPPTVVAAAVEKDTALVGREKDLETLQEKMRVVWNRRGGTILLAGDPGVGKTRLAYEALRLAALSRITTLAGAAYEQEGHLPYQPFVEAFDRYLVEQQRPPEQHPITHFKPLGARDPQQEHSALFKAAESFLLSLATRTPVVLLLDDLHAADEASLNLFHYLARQTRAAPIILLATYRTDAAIDAVSPFGSLLHSLYRERISEVIQLAPLEAPVVAEMIGNILGGEVDPALVESVFEIAEGNPFFVQQITQAMLKEDHLHQEEGQWRLRTEAAVSIPSELRELLRARVQRLGPDVETTLTAAAILGREFRFKVLREVTGLPDNGLLDALDAALAAQLVHETEEGYRFRHSLIRQTLYDTLSRARRTWLHTRAAEAIETIYGGRPQGLRPHAEMLAYHYELSSQSERALPYLLQAGEKAAEIYALEVANDYFERALALMDELGIDDQAQRWMILEKLGWIALIMANTARAVARYEQALALPPTETWQPSLNDRVRAHRWAARVLITSGQAVEAEQHLQAALAEVGDRKPEPEDYAYLLHDISLWHWHRSEYQTAYEVAQRSLEIARRENDREATGRAYEALALACHSLGEWQQGLRFEQERAALVGSNLDVTTAYDAHLCLWEYHLYGDKAYEEIKETVDLTLQQARRIGAPRAIALCQNFVGALELQVAHWAEAEAALRESIELYRQMGAAAGVALACQHLGMLQTIRGQIEEGLATLQDGVIAAKQAILRAHLFGRLYSAIARNRLIAGDLEAADHALSLGISLTQSGDHGQCKVCQSLLLPVGVSVRIAQGDLAGAGETYRQLKTASERYGSRTWLGLASQAEGELAEARGDYSRALAAYQRAYEEFQPARNEFEAAQCRAALTRLQQLQPAKDATQT